MKNFLTNLENNKKLLVSTLVVILFGALFLRFYKLDKTFSDYDDIGVLALHKIPSGEKSFTIFENDYLDVSGKVDLKKFSDKMLDSPFFAPYIGKVWTYPPGQYIFYPPLISESDSPDTKIWKGRAVSAFFSFLSVVLLAYFLILINKKKLSWAILLSVVPLSFSFNNVIYSHHMSPYSINVTTLLTALICFHFLTINKIKNYQFAVILSFLTYFNYLILLTLPVFGIILFMKQKEELKGLRNVFMKIIIPVFCYTALFLPGAALFLKTGRGMHGGGFSFSEEGFVGLLTYFPKKYLLITNSNMAFLTTNELVNTIISCLLFGLFFLLFYRVLSKKSDFSWPLCFSLLFMAEWSMLHLMGKLVLLDSRHLLIWTPLFCIMLFIIINEYSKPKVFALLTAVFLIPSFYANIHNITSKNNNFDREIIAEDPTEVVLTYGGTLGPMLYFANSKTVYNIEFKTFALNYKSMTLPDRMLLTSTDMTFEEFQETEYYRGVKGLFDQHKVTLIKGLHSEINLLYNNKGFSGGENHFYLYEMKARIEVNAD